jgi:hypothetical protein
MPTNQTLLAKGIKYLVIALPQMFIGPAVIYNAFMNKHTNWHYLILVIGCGLCLGGMYFAFQGINTVVKGLFNDEK